MLNNPATKYHPFAPLISLHLGFQNDYKTAHLVEQRSSGWESGINGPMDTTRKLRLFNLLGDWI